MASVGGRGTLPQLEAIFCCSSLSLKRALEENRCQKKFTLKSERPRKRAMMIDKHMASSKAPCVARSFLILGRNSSFEECCRLMGPANNTQQSMMDEAISCVESRPRTIHGAVSISWAHYFCEEQDMLFSYIESASVWVSKGNRNMNCWRTVRPGQDVYPRRGRSLDIQGDRGVLYKAA